MSTWDALSARHIKAGCIDEKNPTTFTIVSVEREVLESMDRGKKPMPVLRFKETDLDFPLNSTNRQCMQAMFGPEASACVGKRVALFVGRDRLPETGQQGPCIRIWGSPDIAQDIEVAIKLPKKRPQPMTMHATGRRGAVPAPGAKPAAPAQPPLAEAEIMDLLGRINQCGDPVELDDLKREARVLWHRMPAPAQAAVSAAIEQAAARPGMSPP